MKKRCSVCGIDCVNDTICSECNNNEIKRTTPIKSLFYIFDGVSLLLKNKSLIKLSLFPILITTFVLILIYIFIISLFVNGLSEFIPDRENLGFFYSLIKPLLGAFGIVLISFVSLFLFLPLSSIICIPFNDIISEKTEMILLNKTNKDTNSANLFFSIQEGIKLLIFKVILLIILFPLNFIPVVGNIIYLIILSMTISLDFLDLIMTRKKYSLSDKISFIKINYVSYLFFSLQFLIFFWIPILQILLIPCSAISATKFFIESEKNLSN